MRRRECLAALLASGRSDLGDLQHDLALLATGLGDHALAIGEVTRLVADARPDFQHALAEEGIEAAVRGDDGTLGVDDGDTFITGGEEPLKSGEGLTQQALGIQQALRGLQVVGGHEGALQVDLVLGVARAAELELDASARGRRSGQQRRP